MIGGTGDDLYFADEAGDQVIEADGEGFDILAASTSYVLAATASIELITTGFIAGTAAINLTGSDTINQIWGNDGVNTLNGAGGDDALFGYAANDVLIGGAGNDYLNGGDGVDAASGGAGDDTYFVDVAGDTVTELANEGNDVLAAGVSYTLGAGAHIELTTTGFIGGTNAIDLTGNELANQLWGNDGVNTLNGGGGDDTLLSFGGGDVLDGGLGNDVLIGGTGKDVFAFTTALGGVALAAGIGRDRLGQLGLDALRDAVDPVAAR